VEAALKEAAVVSMGTEVSEHDMVNIWSAVRPGQPLGPLPLAPCQHAFYSSPHASYLPPSPYVHPSCLALTPHTLYSSVGVPWVSTGALR